MSSSFAKKVLDAVTATGASEIIETNGNPFYSMMTTVSGAVTGGTVKLQGSLDGTNFVDIVTDTIGATGTTSVSNISATGAFTPYKQIRANVATRTDGTYTVYLYATGHGGAGER